jgi:deoxycytidylate deaminase
MLVNGGITRVVLWESYPDPLAQELFAEAAIPVETIK